MTTLFEQLQETAQTIRERREGFTPTIGVILGSGLGDWADKLEDVSHIPYAELPHFPKSSVAGHAGRLAMGKLGNVSVVAMQGRVHGYEGYAPWQVAYPARVLGTLGIKTLVVTNASGSINANCRPGELLCITDHINLSGQNPLTGPNDERLGPRFPDMSAAYSPALVRLCEETARSLGITLHKGVYAYFPGPTYETPAEIRMLRTLGADAVGMSTVPEVIVAAHMGIRVVGISCLTNLASGISDKPLTHEEVAQVAHRVRDVFGGLLDKFLPAASAL